MLDEFDPNTWQESEAHEYRIYASNDPDFYVVVDQIDYSFLAQYSWSVHTYNNGKLPRKPNQLYLRRSISDFLAPDGPAYINPETGYWTRNRKRVQRNLFLHFVVMLRKTLDEGCYPPTKHHFIVDHENNDTRNCRRANVRWVTHSDNTSNRKDYVNKKPKTKRSKRA